MRSTTRRLAFASNAIVLAYATRTAFALALLGPFGLQLASELDALSSDQGGSSATRFFELAIATLPAQLEPAIGSVAFYALLAPLLSQLVLEALLRPAPVRALLQRTRPRYSRALLASVVRWLLLALCVLVAIPGSALLASLSPLALAEAARLTCVAIACFAALWIGTTHDLCAAALARGPVALRSALLRAVQASNAHASLRNIAFGLGSLAVVILSDATARALAAPLLALGTQQAFGLANAFLRAQWLAVAAERLRD